MKAKKYSALNVSKPTRTASGGPGYLSVGAAVSAALGFCASSHAGQLPVPCIASACGANASTFVSSGAATATASANQLTINQSTPKAVLNWSSFNVDAGNKVTFNQPSTSALALNRIFQNDPSRISGSIKANGQIYLINQNGIIFGSTAQVNANSLVASSLDITPEALANGILSPQLVTQGYPLKPAFTSSRVYVTDENGNQVLGADGKPLPVQVQVQAGAQISSDAAGGGRVMLLGQQVDNAGSVSAPSGQVIMAAGQSVYLQASGDPKLRGLLVEVDTGGKVWNEITGNVAAPQGNVTLLGLAVNQAGRVSATTSVNANGSIRLLAEDTAAFNSEGTTLTATKTGNIELGPQSSTTVLPELASTDTAVNDQAQNPSTVEITGRQIHLEGGSQIVAPGGAVTLAATQNPELLELAVKTKSAPVYDPNSEVRVDAGATIDVSGSNTTLPMSANLVTVQLRATEFADDPLQRDGPLRGKTVVVDARVGTTLANVKGDIGAVPHTIGERTSTGGNVSIQSEGDAVLAQGSTVNVSGGSVSYTGGVVATSKVVGANGRVYDIGTADPNQSYVGVINPTYTVTDSKWGVVKSVNGPSIGTYEPGYVQGANAGSIQLQARGLIVNGSLTGNVVNGPLQRDATSRAQGGSLIIGFLPDSHGVLPQDLWAPSVTFVNSVPNVAIDLDHPLPSWFTTLELPTAYLDSGGFTRTAIYSNGSVNLPAQTALNLAPYSTFSLEGATVNVGSSIRAPGATLNFSAIPLATGVALTTDRPSVTVTRGVQLDASGEFVNDSPTLVGPNPMQPTAINGGSVQLSNSAIGALISIGDGAGIDVSAGAWAQASGKVAYGTAGTVSITASSKGSALSIGSGVTLTGYGAQGSSGGQLNIAEPRLSIVHSAAPWATAQSVDFSDPTAGAFELSDALFSSGGFSKYSITANGPKGTAKDGSILDPLSISGDVDIEAQPLTRIFSSNLISQPTTATPLGLYSIQLLPQYQRAPTALAFNVSPNSSYVTTPAQAGDLSVAKGAFVGVDPGSSISLGASTDIRVDGTLSAPAGNISITLSPPSAVLDPGYQAAQGIYLGPDAALLARGVAQYVPNDLGLRKGQVLGGGAITLTASRGSLFLRSGALIDASGVNAPIDVAQTRGGSTAISTATVSSAGGAVALTAAEGMDLGARILAASGTPSGGVGPGGGSLSVMLSRPVPSDLPDINKTFPATPRSILVVSGQGTQSNGDLIFDPALIDRGGFSSLTLAADDSIRFAGGTALTLGQSLALRAPNLVSSGSGTVSLAAPFIGLGPTNLQTQTPAAATSGLGTLQAQAGLIELSGNLSLQGFASTTLSSANDLRAIGVLNGQQLTGSFNAAGELNLNAREIYPTTLTQFTINVAGGTITTGSAGTAQPVLEAGGSLTLAAASIDHGGSIVAPLGTVTLQAQNQLTLESGSLVSVSGDGQTIPFGMTATGTGWLYQLTPNTLPIAIDKPPAKGIHLSGADVDVKSAATVDISGGGDLYAYEWVPGTGGTQDALAANIAGNTYAILPGQGAYAPYDPQESNPALQPGASIYLSGVPGSLAAGTYTLLPARYALLPGAFLVTPVSNTTNLQPGSGTSLGDGTPVVSGYYTVAGTSQRDSLSSGFAVRPGSYGRQLAQYNDSFGSTFFQAAATAAGTPVPQLPIDSGSLSLAATHSLALNGNFVTAAAKGGRGANVDLAASNIDIVSQLAPDVAAGAVQLTAQELGNLNAQSLLIGGTRSEAADGSTSINVTAQNISVGQGASLSSPELLLAARDSVVVDSGAQLSATGTALPAPASNVVSLESSTGSSALLRVSTGGQIEVQRVSPAFTAGLLDVQSGAALSAGGSITLSATQDTHSNGTLDAHGGSVSLESSLISLGDGSAADHGLMLSSQQLANLGALAELQLISHSSIDFYGGVSLGSIGANGQASLGSLLLQSPQIRGAGDSNTAANVAAGTVRLANGSSVSAGAGTGTGTGTGTLSLTGNTIEFDSGQYGFSGFSKVSLLSNGDLLANGTAVLSSASDLALSGARLIGTGGADLTVDASGHSLSFVTPAGTVAGSVVAGLGARLSMLAGTIDDAGLIQLPSGHVSLAASQSLKLESGAGIDTSGVVRTLGSSTVSTPGGTASLMASTGDVVVSSGAAVNVAGGSSGGAAGTISVSAGGTADLQGTFSASTVTGNAGGSFLVNAAQVANFGALNSALNSSGFSERRRFEIGSGDLTLAAGETISARQVGISVDAGSLTVNGTIDAHADHGAAVQLFARDGLTLGSTGSILADSTGSSAVGGSVELGATQGIINTAAGSSISVAGAAGGGTVQLRALSNNTSGVQIGALDGTIDGAMSVTVNVVRNYDNVTQIDDTLVAQVQSDLANFDTTAAAIAQSLGKTSDPTFHAAPAVEINSTGDLTLASAWDLSSLRTATGQAGELTLHAAGNLNLNAILSDGFTVAGTKLTLNDGASWSYQLVAGANLAAADPNAIAPLATLAAGSGDVAIGSGVSIRTGVGSIDVNAGRDVTFADQTSVLYTAGVPASAPITVRRGGTINFANGGGDIRITAGNDVVGASTNQLATGWLLRQAPTFRDETLYYGVGFEEFQDGVGALGGGNVSISAGRDITNLAAVIPTSGQGNLTSQTAITWGGGDLSISAGRDVSGGLFYVDNGIGTIAAGRTIGTGANDGNGNPFAPVLALGAGSINATAGNGLTLETILDPTLQAGPSPTFFATYAPDSSAHLLALSGTLTLRNDEAAIASVDPNIGSQSQPPHAATTYPGTLSAVALDGDIGIGVVDEMGLFPSPNGNLDLLASGSVSLGSGITESDAFGVAVPTVTNPIASHENATFGLNNYASGALHSGDSTIDHIVAVAGDVSGGLLSLAEPVDITAGRDISNVGLRAQNLRPTDATVLQAGRDISYASATPDTQIEVGGPGSLDLFAGRNVNLGFTQGISTVGATVNPLLAATGADINVFAGLGRQPDYAGFIQQYLAPTITTYSDALINYVETISGLSGLTGTSAFDAFKSLPFENELPLVLSTFFTELRNSGRDANNIPGAGYKRGFTAINTLFPGSTQADGSTTPAAQLPYAGDLTLYFSRIYTVAGGNINLLVPGGLIDVGLATVPASVAQRQASQLGIVTQGPGNLNAFSYGDDLVNASRMFTLDGGSIVIWSSAGNIDAGKGAKSAISAPPPIVTVDASGNVKVDLTASAPGSGIRTIQTDPKVAPGDVDLIAPTGFVNAGDAGIGSAGNLNIAAPVVLGVDNIQAGGKETGVPLATNSLAAGLTGAANTASAATNTGEQAAAPGAADASKQSAADTALGWLDVFVMGLGEENCKPEDAECLKRGNPGSSEK